MITKKFTLPDWEFIGGTTQPYEFKLKNEEGHVYDIEGATASVAVAPFVNPTDVIWSSSASGKAINVTQSPEDNNSYCVVKFEPPLDAAQWSGKYIYQITVKTKDGDNTVVAAQQGRMFVTKNIDADFLYELELM